MLPTEVLPLALLLGGAGIETIARDLPAPMVELTLVDFPGGKVCAEGERQLEVVRQRVWLSLLRQRITQQELQYSTVQGPGGRSDPKRTWSREEQERAWAGWNAPVRIRLGVCLAVTEPRETLAGCEVGGKQTSMEAVSGVPMVDLIAMRAVVDLGPAAWTTLCGWHSHALAIRVFPAAFEEAVAALRKAAADPDPRIRDPARKVLEMVRDGTD